jgi:hypothetical protein
VITTVPGSKGRVIVFGIAFWYPLAGVTYQFLHYLIGLRRLGYDVYYIEDSGRWVYDPRINDISPDAGGNVDAVAPILEAHGLAGRWAFRGKYPDGRCYGMEEEAILRLYREADVMLNVTGAQEIREEHLVCPRRVYVESDPFASQVRVAHGNEATIAALDAHDTHFSFGENIGLDGCDVPVSRYEWLPTRQPVVMDLWDTEPSPPGAAYTTITTWHNKGKGVVHNGDTYHWTKDREFERFIDLPRRRQERFELAVSADDDARRRLTEHGWGQIDSVHISGDTDRYRSYIAQSRAEFTVARDQYVRPRTGWFSDRSACYLAAGRPVVTQETGFSRVLPTGDGLFAFSAIDDVLGAVDAIETDYGHHCRRARDIAAEYFSAERVLASLMARAGL